MASRSEAEPIREIEDSSAIAGADKENRATESSIGKLFAKKKDN